MARPGLKQPPRHAVVVRVGDAPATGEIPLARQSKPPPEPVPFPYVSSLAEDEKVTLRAIPTPSAPRAAELPPVIESVPPPSDMPVVASVRPPEPERSKTSRRSGAAIAWAAAAGLVLGLGSVAMSRLAKPASSVSAAAGVNEQPPQAVAAPAELVPPKPLASTAPVPSQRVAPPPSAAPLGASPPKPARRAIF
jgi:hypothetical protein